MLQSEFSDLIDENSSEIHPSLSLEQLSKNNEYYLYNKELLNNHLSSLPPIEAYLYFPKNEEQIIINPNNKEDIIRLIFNNVKYTSFEYKKLRNLYEEIRKNNNKKKEFFQLPKYWNDSESVRYLQASEFKISNTIKLIKETINFNENYYPFQINEKIIKILNSGLMFLCGKDKKFRPVIIVNARKCTSLLNENYTIEEIQQTIIYFLNYIIKYHLIPGQIENWIIISDLNEVGITELSNFKKILDIFSKFRGRVFRNFIVNMGRFLKFGMKSILNFVGSSSLKKIKILNKEEIYQNLLELINKNYIPLNYGGLLNDNLNEENIIFPPNIPKIDFFNDLPDNILTEEDYKIKCLKSENKPLIICPFFKEKWEEEEKIKMIIIEEEKQKKKLEEERDDNIRKMKTLRTNSLDEWKTYYEQISYLIIPCNENILNNYIPFQFNILDVGNFNIVNNFSPLSNRNSRDT